MLRFEKEKNKDTTEEINSIRVKVYAARQLMSM